MEHPCPSAGTYVRALVEDIGQLLGVGAHLTALRRLDCGGLFTLENSSTLEEIEYRVSLGDSGFVFNPADYLPQFQPFSMDEPPCRSSYGKRAKCG